MMSVLQIGLTQDTVQCTRRQIVRQFSRDCHSAALGRVLELAMTSARANDDSAILLHQFQYILDLHKYIRVPTAGNSKQASSRKVV
jgi:hypothetical protein